MKKLLFPLILSFLLPLSTAQASYNHFKIHYGAAGAFLGISKGVIHLLRDKEAKKLSFSKKAGYLGKCAMSGFFVGILGGAYLSIVLENCKRTTSPEMTREQMKAPNQCITISREALEEYMRVNNIQSGLRVDYLQDKATIECTDFLNISPHDTSESIGRKYRQACRKFHPDSRAINSHHSEEIIRAINDAGERLKWEKRF